MVKKAQVPGLPVQETNETENQEIQDQEQDQEQDQQDVVFPDAKSESKPQQSNKPQLTDKGWLVPERGK